MTGSIGITGQRGFWLRCFLGAIAIAGLISADPAHSQIDLPGPIHIVHLRGVIVNPKGQPVANADVSLLKNDQIAFATHTDAAGRFDFEHVAGHFLFSVKKTHEFSGATRNVVVEFEMAALARKQLYVILGPAACDDNCSSVFTSKGDFDKVIRRNTQHSY